MSSSSSSSSSVRYSSLIKGIDKVLIESRNAIDVEQAVAIAYEKDAQLFGGPQVLIKVMEGMLDRVSDTVTSDMVNYLVKSNKRVEQELQRVEHILSTFSKVQEAQQKCEELDSASAKQALQQVQLPEKVTPMHVVQYRAHQLMLQEQQALKETIQQLEDESNALEEKVTMAESDLKKQVETIEQVGNELDRTADVCSGIS